MSAGMTIGIIFILLSLGAGAYFLGYKYVGDKMFGKKKMQEAKEIVEEPKPEVKEEVDHVKYFLENYNNKFGVEDTGSVLGALECNLMFATFCEIRELKQLIKEMQ